MITDSIKYLNNDHTLVPSTTAFDRIRGSACMGLAGSTWCSSDSRPERVVCMASRLDEHWANERSLGVRYLSIPCSSSFISRMSAFSLSKFALKTVSSHLEKDKLSIFKKEGDKLNPSFYRPILWQQFSRHWNNNMDFASLVLDSVRQQQLRTVVLVFFANGILCEK